MKKVKNKQENKSSNDIMDSGFERKLLASQLVSAVQNTPDKIAITLTGTGVIEFAREMKLSLKEETPFIKYIPSQTSTISIIDNSYVSKKELVEIWGMNPHLILRWQKSGLLPAIKIGRQVYYKKEEIEKITR